MFDLTPHIARLHNRFEELEGQLAEGSVFSNPAKAQEVTREHSRLKLALENHAEMGRKERSLADNACLLAKPENEDPEFLKMLEVEQGELEADICRLRLGVESAILPPDPADDRNVMFEIRAGTGGSEAALFAADLFRMYSRFIERKAGWKIEVLECSPADIGGLREVIFCVSGEQVFRQLRFESGVHRVQRVPATEAQGRIHTSTATVAVLPEAQEVDLVIKSDELRIEVCRAGGPGGQGVNTTDSAVQITHIPTGMIVRCQDGRSQLKNKDKALSILRSRLLEQKQAEADQQMAAQRKSQVGTGDRNEKIRTYNYPQNRITDHRIGRTTNDLSSFMEGYIQEMLDALVQDFVAQKLLDMQNSQP